MPDLRRSLTPAHHAAQTLQRYQADFCAEGSAPPAALAPPPADAGTGTAGNRGSASTSCPAAAGRRAASGPAGGSGDGAPAGQGEGSRKGVSVSHAHEPGGAGAGSTAPRRFCSYPLWEGEGVNPNPNPVTCSTGGQPRPSSRAGELGSAEVAHADAARQGAMDVTLGQVLRTGDPNQTPWLHMRGAAPHTRRCHGTWRAGAKPHRAGSS